MSVVLFDTAKDSETNC